MLQCCTERLSCVLWLSKIVDLWKHMMLSWKKIMMSRTTNQIPGCRGWHFESSKTRRLGCSIGRRGWVMDIVFRAPSLSAQSSSLCQHSMIDLTWAFKYENLLIKNFHLWVMRQSSKKNHEPVSFIGWWCIGREMPPAHLKHSNKEQGMDSQNARRNSQTKNPSCPLSCIAEIECVGEGRQSGVELKWTLQC